MATEWILSVGQLNEYVRRSLAGDPLLRQVMVRGEISGFKRHGSGHLYFSLKDESARVQCVLFRQNALLLDFDPRDGQNVVATGGASLFVRDGSFQLYVQSLRPEGAGALYARFEELKNKLLKEGLFDESLKKPIPFLSTRVGIVTSATGAALQDMLRVLKRRYPNTDVLISPCKVQGEGAAAEIAAALDALNAHGGVDVILCGRGGGSIEDLWAFNEEIVARAIARSTIPVISCVGHEVDTTIADFVADLRAATPSVAAELAVPVRAELEEKLDLLKRRAQSALEGRVLRVREALSRVRRHPMLARPDQMLLKPKRDALSALRARLISCEQLRVQKERARLKATQSKLAALNPGAVLERGYALVSANGRVAAKLTDLLSGMDIQITMRGGVADATILRLCPEDASDGEKK